MNELRLADTGFGYQLMLLKKYRDTPPISIAILCKSMPSSWQRVVYTPYTPPIWITIRLPCASRCFCRSTRSGVVGTPSYVCVKCTFHICARYLCCSITLKIKRVMLSHLIVEVRSAAPLQPLGGPDTSSLPEGCFKYTKASHQAR